MEKIRNIMIKIIRELSYTHVNYAHILTIETTFISLNIMIKFHLKNGKCAIKVFCLEKEKNLVDY